MIDVLLSTYNGGKYLKQQLDSLFEQTYQEFRLLVRDDGSTDNSVEILESYAARYPEKLKFLRDGLHLGSTGSFGRLLELSDADYFMFCDQDDFWMKFKIETTYRRMKDLEKDGFPKPILVFTDLMQGKENLEVFSGSFIKSQKLNPDISKSPIKIAALNIVTGCTMMLNKEARSVVVPIPPKNIIHDQWIAMKVAQQGIVSFIDQSTIIYRIHAHNTVGANNVGLKYFAKKISKPVRQIKIYATLLKDFNALGVLQFIYYKTIFNLKRL